MKSCIACNNQLNDDAKFCGNCGERQPKPENVVEPQKAKQQKKKGSAKKSVVTNKTSPVVNKASPIKSKQTNRQTKKPVSIKSKKRALSYHEKLKNIYARTSQNNCGECGCKNCFQFAMQAATPNNPLDESDCPYIDEE